MSGGGAAIGFALVFVVTAWTVSALFSLLLAATAARLRRLGPAAERRLTALVAALPVLIAVAVVATLVVRSVAGADHCPDHDHHAHLCIAHGGAWAERPWAVALVAAAAAIVIARLVIFAATSLRARRAVARLRAASRRTAGVRLIDSSRPFCFVAGLRCPEIYASTAAWHGLDPEERDAMIAHERGHVRHRDLAWRGLLEVAAAFGAPLTPAPLLARWEHATERLRDGDAAVEIGDPAAVAAAMVHLCRLGAAVPAPRVLGFPAPPAALDERVEALLSDAPRGDRAASAVGLSWLVLLSAAIVAVATHAEPLHHAFESVLG